MRERADFSRIRFCSAREVSSGERGLLISRRFAVFAAGYRRPPPIAAEISARPPDSRETATAEFRHSYPRFS